MKLPEPDIKIHKAAYVYNIHNRRFLYTEDLKKKIQDHVKRETAPYKYPRVIEFVEELPKTISGKIRRVEIRDQMKKLSEAVAPVVDKTKDMTKKLSEMFPKNKKNASVDDEKAPQAS